MNPIFATILAAISGEAMIKLLVFVLIIGLCLGVVWWMGHYFLVKMGANDKVHLIWNGLFVLLGGLCVVNFLLGLVDRPFIRW